MLNVGMTELLAFLVIAVIVLGPKHLPIAMRMGASTYSRIKRFSTNVQHEFERELKLHELKHQMQQELDKIKQIEQQMQQQLADVESSINQPIITPSAKESGLYHQNQIKDDGLQLYLLLYPQQIYLPLTTIQNSQHLFWLQPLNVKEELTLLNFQNINNNVLYSHPVRKDA